MAKPRAKKPAKVQANEVTYELHTLGWKAFQNLCVSIAGEIWGQTVQIYFDSYDAGQDGAFHGTWKAKGGELFEGSFTVQCKFTAKADKQLHLSDLNDELAKAKRLAARGLADNYFLLTNARLTGASVKTICEAFETVSGVKKFSAHGADSISRFIRESSRLRMLVPRVYGLGDLSQIFDERAQVQAREILSALGDDLVKVVITDAYARSARALVKHGFVLLLGEPACGKSTIAAALAVGALDEWGCSTFKIRTPDELVRHSNPHESKQFFWVDDAFGATQLDLSVTTAWNGVFPHMHAAIRRGARVVFTSRNYIYNGARHFLKESALPVLRDSQVVIHVEDLTKDERQEILYNHIRLGNQPKEFKSEVKVHLSMVAAHPRFSPEIARRLGDSHFTKKLFISEAPLRHFVEHPVELLCEIIRTIDRGSQSALALVFMRGGALSSPVTMTDEEMQAMTRIGGSTAEVLRALDALNGSFLIQSIQDSKQWWRFRHPTIRDALAVVIGETRELMDIYLTGAPVETIFDEVTCGDVGIQGVKVIVPPDRYEMLFARLTTSELTRPMMPWRLNRFLASRCASDFLAAYIERYPEYIASLNVHSYLWANSDVDVIAKLFECGILPDSKRVTTVAAIRELATSTPDAGFLRDNVRKLLTPDEFEVIMEDVRTELLPQLDEIIQSWEDSFSSSDVGDPEGHFDDLVGALRDFQEALPGDDEADVQIDRALSQISSTVARLAEDLRSESDTDDFQAQAIGEVAGNSSRSIFDDIDE